MTVSGGRTDLVAGGGIELEDIPADDAEAIASLRTLGFGALQALSKAFADTTYLPLATGASLQAQIDDLTPGGGGTSTDERINIKDFGALDDGRIVPDGAITSGTNAVSSTLAAFTNADIGKRIAICSTGTARAGGIVGPGVASQGGTVVGYIKTVAAGIASIVTTPGGTTPSNATNTVSGAVVIWGTDNSASIQAAIDSTPDKALAVRPGGLLYAPTGIYVTVAKLVTKDGIGIQGDGIGLTVFCPTGNGTLFIEWPAGASHSVPTTDIHFSDFEVDCRGMIATSGYAAQSGKAFNMPYCQRALVRDVYCHDSLASSFAFDHPVTQLVLQRCYALRGGRLNTGLLAGGSGFGMGTLGQGFSEPGIVDSCFGVDCGNFGIFTENQQDTSTYLNMSVGWIISNSYWVGNRGGIGSCGDRWTRIVNNYCSANTYSGIELSGGSIDRGRPGYENLIANNMMVGNLHGLVIDQSGTNTYGFHQILNNLIAYNTGNGVRLIMGDRDVRNVEFSGNSVHTNARSGFRAYYLLMTSGAGSVGGVIAVWNGATAYTVDNVVYYRDSAGSAKAYRRAIAGTTATDPATDTTNWTVLGVLRHSDLVGNRVWNNGTSNVTGDKDGFRFQVALLSTNLDSNRCFESGATGGGNQAFGYVFDGPMTAGSLSYNRLRDNLSGGWSFTSSAYRDDAATVISGNIGTAAAGAALNPSPVAETPGASPWTRAAAKRPETLHLSGGTVSSVTVGGVQVAASTNTQVPLEEGDAPVITYSSTPTVATRAR